MNTFKTRGLTIIEILVAILILGVVSAAVLSAFPGLLRLNQQASTEQRVTIVATNVMEDVRQWWTTESQAVWSSSANVDQLESSLNGAVTVDADAELSCAGLDVSDPSGDLTRLRVEFECTPSGGAEYSFVVELGRP